jgi:hypothetical protein
MFASPKTRICTDLVNSIDWEGALWEGHHWIFAASP